MTFICYLFEQNFILKSTKATQPSSHNRPRRFLHLRTLSLNLCPMRLFLGYFEQREDDVGLDVPNVFCVGYCKGKAVSHRVFNAKILREADQVIW